jgi:hypothetical protein
MRGVSSQIKLKEKRRSSKKLVLFGDVYNYCKFLAF